MKKYLKKNVYEAARDRIEFLFKNFKHIYMSFSGGKDSGVMVNLVCQYMREKGIKRKIGIMTMDNECNYEHSLTFMQGLIDQYRDLLDVYWCCLPISLPCTVSSYRINWQCWHPDEEHLWVRPFPKKDYVVTQNNCPFDWFEPGMADKDFYKKFGDWYGKGEETADLIGIRTDESLHRYIAVNSDTKPMKDGQCWTHNIWKNVYACYPIYDWKVEDIWAANAKFEWNYNKLYDIFLKAGLTPYQMRVACPFMSESKSSLGMYRVIDPHIWAKLVSRVQGANFIATYGKQLNYDSLKLPKGHTWKSFTKFLLATLPVEVAANFRMRIAQSIRFWARQGRGVSSRVIRELDKHGIRYKVTGLTPHGQGVKKRITIPRVPDHLDFIPIERRSVTSWKRFAVTILKNDHVCKYMGLAPTLEQQKRQKEIQAKYSKL